MNKIKVSDAALEEYITMLLPISDDASVTKEQNILKLRDDIRKRYKFAPDLRNIGKNGYRFINAVSDFATHAKPLRETANYRENLFNKTMEGNPITDKAMKILLTA